MMMTNLQIYRCSIIYSEFLCWF